MADDTASDVSKTIDHIVDKAAAGLDQVTHMLAQHAPEAWRIAVHGVYAKGLATLVVGCVSLTASVVLITAATWAIIRAVAAEKEESDGSIPWLFFVVPVGAIGIIMMIISFSNLLDSDAWARVISPDGYLAQEMVTKAVGK